MASMMLGQLLRRQITSGRVAFISQARPINVDSTTKLGFPCAYSDEETKKILNTLNEQDVEELYKYNISKYRLKKIEGWRKKFGAFLSLEQVLELDGFGVTVLRKFYDSIVHGPKEDADVAPKAIKKEVKFTTPALSPQVIPKIGSCVSVYIGLDYVTWARFKLDKDQPTSLTGWNSYNISDRKLHINELIRNVSQINRLIPEADVYVVENPPVAQASAMGSAVQTNINVQRSQLIGMLMLMLANRPSPLTGNVEHPTDGTIGSNVFFLKQYLSARLFGIFIGNERVSSEDVIRSLMERQLGPNEEALESIQSRLAIPSGLKIVYEENDRAEREFLGQSLLLGLTFLRLCIFKCEDSLKIFRR
ncbi:uncharacterized protein LOC131287598 [Anopheles ziemanni]|uniref:uncharacterized protein LOC131259224 n=1 Tax=Anopheles coustani TaxID=139045 RepID=UPI002657CD86|nr:uncharacterized protein LOC131259224 [Anopheles coustani]XP_058172644.1 uncharacterized protein LOC131287598 [Anopheles ziemanni]